MESYIQALKNIIEIYTMTGFKVTTLSCDREYAPLIHEMQKEFNIIPNYCSAQEHVPEAERNNRVIKERVRAVFHSLPFKAIPSLMIKFLAMVYSLLFLTEKQDGTINARHCANGSVQRE